MCIVFPTRARASGRTADCYFLLPRQCILTALLKVRWLAPELLLHNKTFTLKSDVWAFGVTLWEIFSFARKPYGTQHNNEVKEQVREGMFLSRPNECPEEVHELMVSCWRMEPQDRPTFTSIRGKRLCPL